MCKIYFHTGFLPTTGSSLRLRLRDLDGVSSGERFGPEFKAVVNYRFEKDPAQTRAVNADWDLSLIFNSKSDYEMNRSMMFGDGTPPLRKSPSPPPQAPPRTHRAPPVPPKPEVGSRTPSPPIEEKQPQHRQQQLPWPPSPLALAATAAMGSLSQNVVTAATTVALLLVVDDLSLLSCIFKI